MNLNRDQVCTGKDYPICSDCARYYPASTNKHFAKAHFDAASRQIECKFFLVIGSSLKVEYYAKK